MLDNRSSPVDPHLLFYKLEMAIMGRYKINSAAEVRCRFLINIISLLPNGIMELLIKLINSIT